MERVDRATLFVTLQSQSLFGLAKISGGTSDSHALQAAVANTPRSPVSRSSGFHYPPSLRRGDFRWLAEGWIYGAALVFLLLR